MNKKIIIALTILVVLTATLSANGTQEALDTYKTGNGQGSGLRDGSGNGNGQGNGQGRNGTGNLYSENFIDELASVYGIKPGSGTINETDIEGLLLMREEEQLARDVYNNLYQVWNLPIFNNIAYSEQQHMDAVKMIIEAYQLEDPSSNNKPGVFRNPELQQHYNDLVEKGSKSIEEALAAGAMIEDLDIADLQSIITKTDNDELKLLYQNLMKGSRNHMRSFTFQLSRYNESYTPVFISDEYFGKILKYNRESAPISDPDYLL